MHMDVRWRSKPAGSPERCGRRFAGRKVSAPSPGARRSGLRMPVLPTRALPDFCWREPKRQARPCSRGPMRQSLLGARGSKIPQRNLAPGCCRRGRVTRGGTHPQPAKRTAQICAVSRLPDLIPHSAGFSQQNICGYLRPRMRRDDMEVEAHFQNGGSPLPTNPS